MKGICSAVASELILTNSAVAQLSILIQSNHAIAQRGADGTFGTVLFITAVGWN